MKLHTLIAAAILLIAPSSHAIAAGNDTRAGDLVIEAPWTRATPGGAKVGAGYLSIVNTGKEDDRLKAAVSLIAERVEIHTMTMDGGVMRMRRLEDGLVLKAQSVTELRPGGFHIMFIGLKKPIKKGEKLPLQLQFDKAGNIDVVMTAAAIGATKSPHGGIGAAGGSNSGHQSTEHKGSNSGHTGKTETATPKGSH